MDWMVMVAQLLLSISILVAVHEMGHLLAAKYFGMRVEQFSIGFPPKIWSFKKGDTEYALSAIPLGGYVKISGMIDESLDTDQMNKEPQPWEFRSKPAWQRLIVMLGGIIVNIIVGIVIFIGVTFVYGDTNFKKDVINANGGFAVGSVGEKIGLKSGDQIVAINGHDFDYFQDLIKPETLLADDAHYMVIRDGETIRVDLPDTLISSFNKREGLANFLFYRTPCVIKSVEKETIAASLGLKSGDRFVEVNGQPVKYYDEVVKQIKSSGQSISIKVDRAGTELSFDAKFEGEERQLGFYGDQLPAKIFEEMRQSARYGLFESIPLGTNRAFTTLVVQVKAFGKIISGKLSARQSLSGPIGIAQAYGGNWDWERFWSLTGVLSLVLAFMNLLPIPALDGGHVMFLSYEIVSSRKPSDKFLETAQKIGMVFLLTLMVLIFSNDIIRLFN
jgi:regulator of sigma E protease